MRVPWRAPRRRRRRRAVAHARTSEQRRPRPPERARSCASAPTRGDRDVADPGRERDRRAVRRVTPRPRRRPRRVAIASNDTSTDSAPEHSPVRVHGDHPTRRVSPTHHGRILSRCPASGPTAAWSSPVAPGSSVAASSPGCGRTAPTRWWCAAPSTTSRFPAPPSDMVSRPPAHRHRPPRRPRRRHRVQPGRAGAAVPRQPADGHVRHRGGPLGRRRQDGARSARCARTPSSRRCRSPRPSLWDGYPEETNAPYGIAKKAHLVHAQVNAAQYGQRFAYLDPDEPLRPRRQVPSRRVARDPGAHQEVRRGGRGRRRRTSTCGAPGRRAASTCTSTTPPTAIVAAAERRRRGAEPVNLGTDHEVTIRETVETIAGLVGFDGELRWDPTKPDGQPRRRVDASRAGSCSAGRRPRRSRTGLRATIDWYLAHRAEAERIAA